MKYSICKIIFLFALLYNVNAKAISTEKESESEIIPTPITTSDSEIIPTPTTTSDSDSETKKTEILFKLSNGDFRYETFDIPVNAEDAIVLCKPYETGLKNSIEPDNICDYNKNCYKYYSNPYVWIINLWKYDSCSVYVRRPNDTFSDDITPMNICNVTVCSVDAGEIGKPGPIPTKEIEVSYRLTNGKIESTKLEVPENTEDTIILCEDDEHLNNSNEPNKEYICNYDNKCFKEHDFVMVESIDDAVSNYCQSYIRQADDTFPDDITPMNICDLGVCEEDVKTYPVALPPREEIPTPTPIESTLIIEETEVPTDVARIEKPDPTPTINTKETEVSYRLTNGEIESAKFEVPEDTVDAILLCVDDEQSNDFSEPFEKYICNYDNKCFKEHNFGRFRYIDIAVSNNCMSYIRQASDTFPDNITPMNICDLGVCEEDVKTYPIALPPREEISTPIRSTS